MQFESRGRYIVTAIRNQRKYATTAIGCTAFPRVAATRCYDINARVNQFPGIENTEKKEKLNHGRNIERRKAHRSTSPRELRNFAFSYTLFRCVDFDIQDHETPRGSNGRAFIIRKQITNVGRSSTISRRSDFPGFLIVQREDGRRWRNLRAITLVRLRLGRNEDNLAIAGYLRIAWVIQDNESVV